eukprot:COSAG05_NODE_407_length_10145_cov_234.042604_5_plen_166_part_00
MSPLYRLSGVCAHDLCVAVCLIITHVCVCVCVCVCACYGRGEPPHRQPVDYSARPGEKGRGRAGADPTRATARATVRAFVSLLPSDHPAAAVVKTRWLWREWGRSYVACDTLRMVVFLSRSLPVSLSPLPSLSLPLPLSFFLSVCVCVCVCLCVSVYLCVCLCAL